MLVDEVRSDLEKSAPRRLAFRASAYCGPKPRPEHAKVLVAFGNAVVLSENSDRTEKEQKEQKDA